MKIITTVLQRLQKHISEIFFIIARSATLGENRREIRRIPCKMCFHTIPKTPNKYGIKIYSVIDALMFYTYNMDIYEGMQPDGSFFHTTSHEML